MANELILIIGLVSIFQPTRARRIASLCVAIPTALHGFFLPSLDGYIYFHIASITSSLIIHALIQVCTLTKFVKNLVIIECAFFMLSVYGYISWMSGADGYIYETLAMILYLALIATMLHKGHSNERDTDMDKRGSWFRSDWRTNRLQYKTSIPEEK